MCVLDAHTPRTTREGLLLTHLGRQLFSPPSEIENVLKLIAGLSPGTADSRHANLQGHVVDIAEYDAPDFHWNHIDCLKEEERRNGGNN